MCELFLVQNSCDKVLFKKLFLFKGKYFKYMKENYEVLQLYDLFDLYC